MVICNYSGGTMKLLIILTILISGTSHAYTDMRGYAHFVESTANKKLVHSQVDCFDNEGLGFFTCRLEKVTGGDDEMMDIELKWLRGHLQSLNNAHDKDGLDIPKLHVFKE
jgi:hypothetical protein